MRFDMNLKQLKSFYHVAKNLSFTQAAKELFITQPAVTMQIDALEQYFGTKLFLRKKNQLDLTEAGSVLFSYAEQIMRLAFESERAVVNLTSNPHGVLRIGTTKTFARHLLPPFIGRFHEAFPRVRIQLDEGSSQEMALSLIYGRNDLAVVGRFPYDARLEGTPFPGHGIETLAVLLPAEHPLSGRESLTLEDVLEEPLILREKGSGTRHLILERFAERGAKPNVVLEAGNVGFIVDLVERKAGISILVTTGLEEEMGDAAVRAVPLVGEGFSMGIDVLRARDGYCPVAARSFLDFLYGG